MFATRWKLAIIALGTIIIALSYVLLNSSETSIPLFSDIQRNLTTATHYSGFKRVLSYSLFGKSYAEKYYPIVSAMLTRVSKSKLYRTWEVRLYTDLDIKDDQRTSWLKIYKQFVIIDVRKYTGFPNVHLINAMCWRFLPIGDSDVEISCIRDLDTPLIKREQVAVKEFLPTNFIFHGMRDNAKHSASIMGGLWCFRNSKNQELGKLLLKRILNIADTRVPGKREAYKGNDQDVLNITVWPVVMKDSMNHCSFFCTMQPSENTRPFPTKRRRDEFVGCTSYSCRGKEKELKCPDKCKPKEHSDWTYC